MSLSVQQATAIALILGLTFLNTRGLWLGKLVQNAFTWAKSLTLLALAAIGIFIGRNAEAIAANFDDAWTPRGVSTITPDLFALPATSAAAGALGLFVAVCVAQAGSIFAADAWNNVTFTAAEVKNPRRNVPLSLVYGTLLVMTLYVLANVAYLCVLPIERIQHAPDDRVATAALEVVFGAPGAAIMAVAIVISTFGCNNGLVLAGARVCYAMARDGLFFRSTGLLSQRGVPARALALQGMWASLLVLPRIRLHDASGAIVRDRGDRRAALRQPLQQSARVRGLRRAGLLRADHRGALRAAPHAAATPIARTARSATRSLPALYIVARLGDRDRALPLPYRDHAAGPAHRAERAAGLRSVARTCAPALDGSRHDDDRSPNDTADAATARSDAAERLLASIRELSPAIAARAAEIEEGAAAAAGPASSSSRAIGFFRMLLPRRWGGLEIDFPPSVEILAELSAADGSVGWASMIGCETPQLFALLPEPTFETIYADGPDVIVAGAFAPRGTAEAIDGGEGGYRVNGRWSFASGCQHARFLFGNCVVTSGGQPLPGPIPGAPQLRCAVLPAGAWTIHDTWHTAGLRGTGSHDIEIRDALVAKEWTFDLFVGEPFAREPLFGAPLLQFSTHIGAVALGIAQGALRDLIALAGTNKTRLYAKSAIGRLAAVPASPRSRSRRSRSGARAARWPAPKSCGRRRAAPESRGRCRTACSRPPRGWPRPRRAWSTAATPPAAAPRSTATRRSSAGCATSTRSRSTPRCRNPCSRPRARSCWARADRSAYERPRRRRTAPHRDRLSRQDRMGGGRPARRYGRRTARARCAAHRALRSRRIPIRASRTMPASERSTRTTPR